VAIECCYGQAAMVPADHLNLWWGVELIIPLLKHTNDFVCVKIPFVTNANTWEVPPRLPTPCEDGVSDETMVPVLYLTSMPVFVKKSAPRITS
jgi:hypothetical protein